MKVPNIITAIFVFSLTMFFVAPGVQAWDVPDVGPGQCVGPNCGGGGGPSPGQTYTPPRGPSQEELRDQWEQQDLAEAAQDANDNGLDAYDNNDWYNAIQFFKEALEYTPDDEDILDNLRAAESRLRNEQDRRAEEIRRAEEERKAELKRSEEERKAEIARKAEEKRKLKVTEQLKSIEHHSGKAAGMGDAGKIEAGKGFDIRGADKGGLDAVVIGGRAPDFSKEPVIPEGKRTKAIEKLETKRNKVKEKRMKIEEKIEKLSKKPDKTPEETVELVEIKQEHSKAKNEEIFLNFSISEELLKPGETVPVPGK